MRTREDTKATECQPVALKSKEVARLLNVSIRSVWRLVSAGELPAPTRIGKAPRWDREGLLIWWRTKQGTANGQH